MSTTTSSHFCHHDTVKLTTHLSFIVIACIAEVHKLFSASLILEEPRGFTSQVIVEKEPWPVVKT